MFVESETLELKKSTSELKEADEDKQLSARELENVILRNPLIANTLYLSSDIEKWGSGLKRIHEECALHQVPVAFTVLKYGFAVRFSIECLKKYA